MSVPFKPPTSRSSLMNRATAPCVPVTLELAGERPSRRGGRSRGASEDARPCVSRAGAPELRAAAPGDGCVQSAFSSSFLPSSEFLDPTCGSVNACHLPKKVNACHLPKKKVPPGSSRRALDISDLREPSMQRDGEDCAPGRADALKLAMGKFAQTSKAPRSPAHFGFTYINV
jgi:hypothetical protein